MKNEVKEIRESIDSLKEVRTLSGYNSKLGTLVLQIKRFEDQYTEILEKFYYTDLNLRLGRINGGNGILIELQILIHEKENLPDCIKIDMKDTEELLEQFYSDIPESLK